MAVCAVALHASKASTSDMVSEMRKRWRLLVEEKINKHVLRSQSNFGEPSRLARQSDAGAQAQKVHHGWRGDRPFRALNIACDGTTGPTCARCWYGRRGICFNAGTVPHQHASRMAMPAVALITDIGMTGICCRHSIKCCCVILRFVCCSILRVQNFMRSIARDMRVCTNRHQRQPDYQQVTHHFFHKQHCTSVNCEVL